MKSVEVWFEICAWFLAPLSPPPCRYLEEGNVEFAAAEKQRIEDLQRTRRKWHDENNIKYQPRFFKWVRSIGLLCVLQHLRTLRDKKPF